MHPRSRYNRRTPVCLIFKRFFRTLFFFLTLSEKCWVKALPRLLPQLSQKWCGAPRRPAPHFDKSGFMQFWKNRNIAEMTCKWSESSNVAVLRTRGTLFIVSRRAGINSATKATGLWAWVRYEWLKWSTFRLLLCIKWHFCLGARLIFKRSCAAYSPIIIVMWFMLGLVLCSRRPAELVNVSLRCRERNGTDPPVACEGNCCSLWTLSKTKPNTPVALPPDVLTDNLWSAWITPQGVFLRVKGQHRSQVIKIWGLQERLTRSFSPHVWQRIYKLILKTN